jgi:hypothetical protein
MAVVREYSSDRKKFRQLRWKLFLVWVLFVPAVGTFAAITHGLFDTFVPAYFFAGAWIVWFAFAAAEINQFSCPRCGEQFARSSTGWIFSKRCQHCGLKKFAIGSLA